MTEKSLVVYDLSIDPNQVPWSVAFVLNIYMTATRHFHYVM